MKGIHVNHIEIKNTAVSENYENWHWVIDGKLLYQYLDDWQSEYEGSQEFGRMKSFGDLCPAWTKGLEWNGDVRFVWKLIEKEKAILPVLVCPDDLDFTCIVVVADVEKTDDFIYWHRIGCVDHKTECFNEEKKNGILNIDAYSDQDWRRYGDNIAFANVDSEEWCKWIGENWDEELYRRRMNYTYPYYQMDGNINWLYEMNWVFSRSEYEKMTNLYWELETLWQLYTFHTKNKMSVKECAAFICRLTRNGYDLLNEHLEAYGEILLHIFASEQICDPLIELLKENNGKNNYVSIYCQAIEVLWKYGDDSVVNVVDVTILERLSDDIDIWKRFGAIISDAFKFYINNDVLRHNLMMCGVEPLI